MWLGPERPTSEKMDPIENAGPKQGIMMKPVGGLWTSTLDGDSSPWLEWCRAERWGISEGTQAWLLEPAPDAAVLTIDSKATSAHSSTRSSGPARSPSGPLPASTSSASSWRPTTMASGSPDRDRQRRTSRVPASMDGTRPLFACFIDAVSYPGQLCSRSWVNVSKVSPQSSTHSSYPLVTGSTGLRTSTGFSTQAGFRIQRRSTPRTGDPQGTGLQSRSHRRDG